MSEREARWARQQAVCRELFAALDWQALGEIYFHWGGAGFWAERRPKVLDLGQRLARQLLRRVPATGRSLWAGAGVAELPVLLAEALVRDREVVPVTVREPEVEVLNRGLQAVGVVDRVRFVVGDAAAVATTGGYDHLGCISLFTDPETFPLLSDVAYGRIAPVQIDVDTFVGERERARVLAQRLFAGLQLPGWITTSAEEVAWFLEQAEVAGAAFAADEELIDTAVVGDPVGFVRVAAAGAAR